MTPARVIGVLALALLLAAPASEARAGGLSKRAGKRAIQHDAALRTLQASWDAAMDQPATVTYDETGTQVVEYPRVTGHSDVGPCVQVSAQRVRCVWRLQVTVDATRETARQEHGESVARLVSSPRRHIDVSAWVPDARRRSLGDYS